MGNTQHFLLIDNVDLPARSAKHHLSRNCDLVVKYNSPMRGNANIAGNSDYTDFAVAHTKAYKSVTDYLEQTVVNQNEVVTPGSDMFVI